LRAPSILYHPAGTLDGMVEYRLDPKSPPQLTEEEARRLDKAPIDLSDIPELDDEFFSRAKTVIDWSRCPDVESVPGRCGGQPVVKDTRLTVHAIINNAVECSAAEIADMFEVPSDTVRRIVAYAQAQEPTV